MQADPDLLNRRRVIISAIVIAAGLAGLYLLIPQVAGLKQTWGQLSHGNPLWLAVAGLLELLSLASYAALFAVVFGPGSPRIGWRASIEIPLAGIAAIRLLAAAGAGGVAITVWALRQAGMSGRVIAVRMVASLVVQYTVYLGAIVVCGVCMWTGLFAGGGSFALTILPAILSIALGGIVLSMGLLPQDFERRLARLALRSGRSGRLAARLAPVPAAAAGGVRGAIEMIRHNPPALLAAVAYWGFDIAALGLSLRAFGAVVTPAVVVMAYFLGTLGSLLPLPGGIGGVEAGMIGALAAFGVPGDRAVIGVLAYRAISHWLPTLPGIGGYLTLRASVRGWRRIDEATDDDQREDMTVRPSAH